MENSAILAQEKGYIGFVPKTPSLLSRDQSFLNDNLNASVNVPLLKSQVISSEIAEAPSTKTSTNNITAVSQTNLESAPTPANGSEKVAKLELTKKEIPVEWCLSNTELGNTGLPQYPLFALLSFKLLLRPVLLC